MAGRRLPWLRPRVLLPSLPLPPAAALCLSHCLHLLPPTAHASSGTEVCRQAGREGGMHPCRDSGRQAKHGQQAGGMGG